MKGPVAEMGPAPRPAAAAPQMSLLRMSAVFRLCLAGVLVAAIWLTAFWAMG